MITFLPNDGPELKPRITVIGVGGAGGNAVNNMIQSHLEGCEFMVANTDAQSLAQSRAERRLQLGSSTTMGLGAGSRPDVGRIAAEESIDELVAQIDGSHMVFITAGMGGGTGTGAAPVIARAARERGILTVGVVTKPFHFEGAHRMRTAEAGIAEMQQYVDTLIIIPNQNLFRIATERTTFADAFKMADDVLHSGVRGVTDLMMMPGLINLDFSDIRTVMQEMGKAMMGTGEAEGEKRAIQAAEAAISNPLLDDTSMKGAKGVLINITGGDDMTLFEVDEAANRIRDEVDPDANIIFGSTFDPKMTGQMRVSVVATGIEGEMHGQQRPTNFAPMAGAQPAQPNTVQQAVAPQPAAPRPAAPRPAESQAAASGAAPHQSSLALNHPPMAAPRAAVPGPDGLFRQPAAQANPANRVQAAPAQQTAPAARAMPAPAPQPRAHAMPARAMPAHGSTQVAAAYEPQAIEQAEPAYLPTEARAEPHFEAPPAERRAEPHLQRPAPQPQPAPETVRRTPSFFERIAGNMRGAPPGSQPHAQAAPPQPQSRTDDSHQGAQIHPAPVQPRSNAPERTGPGDRAAADRPGMNNVRAPEVDLDIPAFLRRQVN